MNANINEEKIRESAEKREEGPQEWEQPIDIESVDLPSITPEMMPPVLADMVFEVAESTQTPPELAYTMGMAAAATACQKVCAVETVPGHIEQLSIYAIAPLESGNRKSAVETIMVAPIRLYEEQQREIIEPVRLSAIGDRELEEAALKKLTANFTRKGADQEAIKREARERRANLTEIPELPSCWVQDITPEHLGTLMSINNERMGVFSAEGGIFEIIGGRYQKGVPNLDLFLQSHSGDPVKVSRGSREEVSLSCPALSMGISPQPSVLKELGSKPGFRSRGLLARFFYLLPKSYMGSRKTGNLPPVLASVDSAYYSAITGMLSQPVSVDGPQIIRLSESAQNMFYEFAADIETQLCEGGRFVYVRDWAGKLPGLIGRIAGVYHTLQPDGVAISGKNMMRSIQLSSVLIPHALAAFDTIGTDEITDGGRKILDWIRRNRYREFSARDCHQVVKGAVVLNSMEKTNKALRFLEDNFYIRPKTKPDSKNPQGGRPPSPVYEVNPYVEF